MIYGFEPVTDRELLDSNLMYYRSKEKHPTRFLDFHDFFYLVSGSWAVRLEDELLQLQPGDVALLPANLHHYGEHFCVPGTQTLFIHFQVRGGDTILDKEAGPNLPVQSVTHTYTNRILLMFQDIMKMYLLKPSRWEFRCSVLLNQLIIELSDLYRETGVQKDKVIIDILHLFIEHPEKFFSITELAVEAGMSPRSLSAQFKLQTGQSIHKYQINTKLEQIAKILRTNPNASLKNLAYTFGFCDEFHLSSSFKKKFGLSPIRYSNNKKIAGQSPRD